MTFSSIERLYVYLFFILSAFFLALIAFMSQAIIERGILLLVISFVILSRFVYLVRHRINDENGSLPERIITFFDQEGNKQKTHILRRLCAPEYYIWIVGVVIAVLWVGFCTAYPNEIGAIKTLHFELSRFFNDYTKQTELNNQPLVSKILPFAAFALMFLFLCSLHWSLCASRFFIRINMIIFLPAFLVGLVGLSFLVGRVFIFQWPDTHFLVGGGIGVSKILFLLHPNMAADSASFFMARFLETGSIGAYGFYFLFMPALSVFFHVITVRRRRKMLAWLGVVMIGLIIMMDMFWLYSAYGLAVMIIGWFVVLACWGHSGFKTSHINR